MLKAKHVMTTEVVTIGPEATLAEAIGVLLEKKISGMPVVDIQKRLVGIISEKDMLNFAFSGNLALTKVGEAMTREIVSFPPETDVAEIALAIGQRNFRRVPIVEAGRVVGIVSRRDIIRVALLGK
ncbi:MAG: CBS domain-containing protein [candidate division FCPU426 bacterium]